MYVDDLIGVCRRCHRDREISVARELCTKLLGDEAVADEKTDAGRRMDVLGYCFDLDLRRVTIAHKNFIKTLYGYFTTNVDAKIPVKVIERLASWGSRYGSICPTLRAFNRALYSVIWRNDARHTLSRHVSIELTPAAKRTIRLWRAMLVALRLDERRFARSFESFRLVPNATDIGEFDCSLDGAGVLVYDCSRQTPSSTAGVA
jgi:hypothetical protein